MRRAAGASGCCCAQSFRYALVEPYTLNQSADPTRCVRYIYIYIYSLIKEYWKVWVVLGLGVGRFRFHSIGYPPEPAQ